MDNKYEVLKALLFGLDEDLIKQVYTQLSETKSEFNIKSIIDKVEQVKKDRPNKTHLQSK